MVVLNGWYLLVVAVVVFSAWRGICWLRHGLRPRHEIVVLLLFVWSLGVAYVVFFPMNIVLYDWHGRFSLIPLKSSIDMIRFSTAQTVVTNLGGNVLLFVPVGFLLPVLFARLRGVWGLAWRAAVLSAVIEILQIPTQAHSTDTDDLILNVIGALIGLALFKAARALVRSPELRRRLNDVFTSRSRREPLLIAVVPFVIVVALTGGVLALKVVDATLSRDAVVVLAAGPDGEVVARAESDGFLVVVARSALDGTETIWNAEFKNVLPGRYTPTARSEIIASVGSGYSWSMTAYDTRAGEAPVLYVWGRNQSGAVQVAFNVEGRVVYRVPVGPYFAVAFPFDSEAAGTTDLTDLSFTFTNGAGDDVTSQFARW